MGPSDPEDAGALVRAAAVARCRALWGQTPFPADAAPTREIHASVTVLGLGPRVTDMRSSRVPSLVLVYSAVNVLGAARYRLLDPNAWYCLVSTTNVLGEVSVELVRGARLADSTVDVPVGGSGQAGTVNVNVGGSVRVRRVERP